MFLVHVRFHCYSSFFFFSSFLFLCFLSLFDFFVWFTNFFVWFTDFFVWFAISRRFRLQSLLLFFFLNLCLIFDSIRFRSLSLLLFFCLTQVSHLCLTYRSPATTSKYNGWLYSFTIIDNLVSKIMAICFTTQFSSPIGHSTSFRCVPFLFIPIILHHSFTFLFFIILFFLVLRYS